MYNQKKEAIMGNQYYWVPGSHMALDAQKAGEVCAELEREGRLTPKDLVTASKGADSYLHNYFEWDNDVAAEAYREVQASKIIRSIAIVPNAEKPKETARAFVPVVAMDTDETPVRRYESLTSALQREDVTASLLMQAKRDAKAFENKYRTLRECAAIIAEISKVF